MKYECKRYQLIVSTEEGIPKENIVPKYLMIQGPDETEKRIDLLISGKKAYVNVSRYSKEELAEVRRLFSRKSKKSVQ